MKSILISAMMGATVLMAQGAIFEFELGPAVGGAGLLGANERPTPVATTATGGELEKRFSGEPSISFDDSNNTLFINVGWGDQHGFTDLMGTYSMSHIHGPAGVDGFASVLYPLTANIQTDTDGVIVQEITLMPNPNGTTFSIGDQIDQLFAGEWYINIHSSGENGFPGGEIRGQLIPVPEPATYGMIAALALLGFAGYRRVRARTA